MYTSLFHFTGHLSIDKKKNFAPTRLSPLGESISIETKSRLVRCCPIPYNPTDNNIHIQISRNSNSKKLNLKLEIWRYPAEIRFVPISSKPSLP